MALHEEIDRLIQSLQRGSITSLEFFNRMFDQLTKLPTKEKHAALDDLARHADESIRAEALQLWNYLHNEELSKDFEYIRRTTPLQPGTRLILSGGYTAIYEAPSWLNGREHYKATFLAFAYRGADKVPLACVELDDEIDLIGAYGRRHKGRYALLGGTHSTSSVAYSGDDTVIVLVVDSLPEDVAAYYALFPFPLDEAIETHASCRIDDAPPCGTWPLWPIAREIYQALDALDDGNNAGNAARHLQYLLEHTPALRPTVIGALIQKLRDVGPTRAAASTLLHHLGAGSVRALVSELSGPDPTLRGHVAFAIGSFGPAARDALPELEKLLHDAPCVRVRAAMAIWKIHGRTAEMAPIVMEGLKIKELGWDAANCLREMGPDVGDVVTALVELVRSGEDPSWRAQAALALGGMGLEAALAIPVLIDAATDSNEDVRGSAFGALQELRALARVGDLILLEFGGGPSMQSPP